MKKLSHKILFSSLIFFAANLYAQVGLFGVSPDVYQRLPESWFSHDQFELQKSNDKANTIETNLDLHQFFSANPELKTMLGDISFVYGIKSNVVEKILNQESHDSGGSILPLVARRGSHLVIVGTFAEDTDGRYKMDVKYFAAQKKDFSELTATALFTDRDLGIKKQQQGMSTTSRLGLVQVEIDPYESGRGNESVSPHGFGGNYRWQTAEVTETIKSKIELRTSTLIFMGNEDLQFLHLSRPQSDQDSYGLFEILNLKVKAPVLDLKQLFTIPSQLFLGLNAQSTATCSPSACNRLRLKYLGLTTARHVLPRLIVVNSEKSARANSPSWHVLVRDLYNSKMENQYDWVIGSQAIRSRLLEDQLNVLKYSSVISTLLSSASPYASRMSWDYRGSAAKNRCLALF